MRGSALMATVTQEEERERERERESFEEKKLEEDS